MSPFVNLLLIFFLFSPCHAHYQPDDQSFISTVVSQKGLDFLKDLLVTKVVSSLTPLHLHQLERTMKIPLVGNVRMVLSNITIHQVRVQSSVVKLGDTGISIISSGAPSDIDMNWNYSYNTWLVPISISDSGRASVLVEGIEVGLTLGVENQKGALKLFLLECGCYIKNITIKLDGGTSWLYQGVVDAFEEQIETAVEKAISKKLEGGVLKLDSFLQSLPRVISVNNIASMNVTFVNDPVLSNTSIGFEINGLFLNARESGITYTYLKKWRLSVPCTNPPKMLGISLDEAVFSSASTLYYNAGSMQWIVNKVPDQSLLNTAGWRFIVPQLYKKYPNDNMTLNISLSSPPSIRILPHGIYATVYADLIINVLAANDVIPVACISLEIRASGAVMILGNNIAGSVRLNDFSMSLKWSTVSKLRMYLIQPVIRTVVDTVFIPYVNSRLGKGFPLPIIHGFTLEDGEILFSTSGITVCSDVSFTESYNMSGPLIYRATQLAF